MLGFVERLAVVLIRFLAPGPSICLWPTLRRDKVQVFRTYAKGDNSMYDCRGFFNSSRFFGFSNFVILGRLILWH